MVVPDVVDFQVPGVLGSGEDMMFGLMVRTQE